MNPREPLTATIREHMQASEERKATLKRVRRPRPGSRDQRSDEGARATQTSGDHDSHDTEKALRLLL